MSNHHQSNEDTEPGFQRALSPQQRAQRRQNILETAAAMLTEIPVADLALNELSRRVGLARSNILRYFESREAILLEVLDEHILEWAGGLSTAEAQRDEPLEQRSRRFATEIATSLSKSPVLCDLLTAQAGVLERNVSDDVAFAHLKALLRVRDMVAVSARAAVPELTEEQAEEIIMMINVTVAGSWPFNEPHPALRAAYQQHHEVAGIHRSFVPIMTAMVSRGVLGMLTETKSPLEPSSNQGESS
jgi:AcrR family transcriptional regulator